MSRNVVRKKYGYQDVISWKRNKERERRAVIDGCEGRDGYVYIFKVSDGIYKIGMTTNVTKRMKDLSASCPYLKCIWTARVRDRYFAEKDLHKVFKKSKINRECYALNMPSDMLKADGVINKYR